MPDNELEITIGSVELNQNLSPGSNFYVLKNTPEILSTLSTRKTDTEKQGGHGSEDSLSFYEPRIMPIEGEIHAASQSARVTMENNLKAAVSLSASQSYSDDDGYKQVLITDEDGIAKQIYAKVLEPPKFSLIDQAMPESRSFEFVLFAKDPVLYAQALTTSSGPESYQSTTFTVQDGALPTFKDGALPTFQDAVGAVLTVTNAGNFATPPVITITGPTTNPVVTNTTTGQQMDFSAGGGLTLLAGETLTINVATQEIIKTVSSVETDVSGTLSTDSEWIFVDPGDNEFTLFDDTAGDLSGQMEVEFRSAWI